MTIHGFGLLDSPSDGNLCPSRSKLQILNPVSLKATLRFAVCTVFGTCLLLCVRSVWAMSRGSLLEVWCSVQNAAAPQFSSQTAKKEFQYVPSASPTPKDLVRTGRSLAFPNSASQIGMNRDRLGIQTEGFQLPLSNGRSNLLWHSLQICFIMYHFGQAQI